MVSNPSYVPTFKQLNFQTFYDDASSGKSNASAGPLPQADAPAAIVVCSWMNASLRNVAKFTSHYRIMYPSTPILLITSRHADFIYISDRRHLSLSQPGVKVLSSLLASRPAGSQILLHSFSNGGTGQLTFFCRAWYQTMGTPIPARALVIDSAPALADLATGMHSFSVGLTSNPFIRWPVQAIFFLTIILLYTIPALLQKPTLDRQMREWVNSTDPEYIPKNAKRWYVFSDADDSIPERDVIMHTEDAKAKGIDVELERWKGTGHVGHMRNDPDRYWGIVKRAWGQTTKPNGHA